MVRRVLLPEHLSGPVAPDSLPIRTLRGESMGTTWSVHAVEGGAAVRLQEGLQAQLDTVVAQMSHWRSDSDLASFNQSPAGSWHTLPSAFFEVLSFALDVARDSGGAYDPAAGAMVNLWGFGPHGRFDQPEFTPPSGDEIAVLLAQRRGQRLEIDAAARRVRQPGGALLDLSAVAKGYSVDRLARFLEGQGIAHYLVEVGGELRGAGTKPDGQPWWVTLEQVGDAEHVGLPGEIVLALHGLSVATSGDYRRYFRQGAARFSHTIDPRRGVPIDNDLASVTVIHADCMAADAWSTALTVLGPEQGLALAERLDLAARFVVRREDAFTELMSRAMLRMLDE